MAELKDRIKELRVEKGLRQIDLANELSVSKATVSLWERGNVRPEFTTCVELAEYFNVTLAYLLGSSENRVPDTSDLDLEELAIQGVCDDYREMFLKYVRLSQKSRAIVDATIHAAFRADMDSGELLEDGLFYILVMDREIYEKRKQKRESEGT